MIVSSLNKKVLQVADKVRAKVGSLRKERGASLVEYALLIALIAVVCIAAITLLGTQISGKFSQIGSSIAT